MSVPHETKGILMKAVIDDVVVAEADDADVISIEGNSYFPPSALKRDAFEESPTPYTCPWKGAAQYWNVNGNKDAAWSYPEIKSSAVDRVGKDFAGYVAFDKQQVSVTG
jgi:uncharacterized protein (DUF427 family)